MERRASGPSAFAAAGRPDDDLLLARLRQFLAGEGDAGGLEHDGQHQRQDRGDEQHGAEVDALDAGEHLEREKARQHGDGAAEQGQREGDDGGGGEGGGPALL